MYTISNWERDEALRLLSLSLESIRDDRSVRTAELKRRAIKLARKLESRKPEKTIQQYENEK